MSQFGKSFDMRLDKHITGNYGEDQLERIEDLDYADKQVVDNLIRENIKLLKQIRVIKVNHFLLEDNFNKLNIAFINLKINVGLMDKFIQNFLMEKVK